jgi:hypothetical protein
MYSRSRYHSIPAAVSDPHAWCLARIIIVCFSLGSRRRVPINKAGHSGSADIELTWNQRPDYRRSFAAPLLLCRPSATSAARGRCPRPPKAAATRSAMRFQVQRDLRFCAGATSDGRPNRDKEENMFWLKRQQREQDLERELDSALSRLSTSRQLERESPPLWSRSFDRPPRRGIR